MKKPKLIGGHNGGCKPGGMRRVIHSTGQRGVSQVQIRRAAVVAINALRARP